MFEKLLHDTYSIISKIMVDLETRNVDSHLKTGNLERIVFLLFPSIS